MATVNLGSIKFKWKGTYNGATAYTVDDVVEYNGSSFICILASTGNLPTNATYFEQMSSAGTNGTDGTDLTTTLTTQGDIVYRDASGLARLGAGTSGQVLQTNGTGANPSWVDASGGKVVQQVETAITGVYSSSSTSFTTFSGLPVFSITPTSSSNKILFQAVFYMACGNWGMGKFQRSIGGGSYADFNLGTSAISGASNAHIGNFYDYNDASIQRAFPFQTIDTPNTTSQVDYRLVVASYNPDTVYINRSRTQSAYPSLGNTISHVLLTEITT